ncbi:MAG: helix-turn-helix transcriptional regulator [Clostridiales bacterium]|nr:helix-turn-helix transcriptional regulator [Clostridiales bacterium]
MSNDNLQRILMYKTLLDQAVGKRKENITAKELAEKLKIEPTSVYRMERGVNDIKLSTFIAYLDAFNFQIEITPKTDSVEKETNVDFVTDGDVPLEIEYFKTNPSALDRKQRLSLIKYLIDLEERSLGED